MVTAPILVVQHATDCPPAWFGTWLTDAGARLDVRHPYAGQPLPLDLTAHSGLLVLGGPMGANDDDEFPWLAPTKALVRAGASHGIPVLGICLGHQLAAVALGGVVAVNPGGQQAGLLDVGWAGDPTADPLMTGCGSHAVQWNHDVVTGLPPGSTVLARAGSGELQAARLAPWVWGVQWHPEAGVDVIRPWAEEDRAAMEARGLDVDGRLREVEDATDRLRADWRPLATNFAAIARHPT